MNTSLAFPLFPEVLPLADEIFGLADRQDRVSIVILRGMYGSGKTTFANELAYVLARLHLRTEICSADQFLYDPSGHYVWSPSRLTWAHQACRTRFGLAKDFGYDCIIVDNTNLRRTDFEEYMPAREDRTYQLFFVHFECPGIHTAHALADRSRHQIPVEIVDSNFESFEWCNDAFGSGAFYGRMIFISCELDEDTEWCE